MHAKFVLELHVPFLNPDINTQFTQRVSITSVSAYDVCILCIYLEVFCVTCEGETVIKEFESIFRDR